MSPEGTQLYGIDIEDPNGREQYWMRSELDHVAHYIKNPSIVVATNWTRKIGVIHIDGDHSYEGCKADIEAWYPHMKESGAMFFHDCDASSVGVMRAVTEFVDTHKIKRFQQAPELGLKSSLAVIYL